MSINVKCVILVIKNVKLPIYITEMLSIMFTLLLGGGVLEGRSIADLRKQKGMTQEELAHLLSITTVTLSRWENGHFEP